MIDKKIIKALRDRYSSIYPLIFHRSIERSKTAGELFDILDTFPNKYPVVWNEDHKRWLVIKDLFQAKSFEEKIDEEIPKKKD